MNNPDLELFFYKKRHERGKDNNWDAITIEISGKKIKISKEYGGFKAQKNEYLEKEITTEDEIKIRNFIKDNQLDIKLKEIRTTENIGTAGYFKMEIYGENSSKIKIEGKTRMSGTDEYVRKKWGRKYVQSRTNIKNIDFFSKANSFIFLITNL